MQARLLVVAALGGCGFHTGASIDGAVPADARDGGIDLDATDAPIDVPLDVNSMAWTRRKAITIDGSKVASGTLAMTEYRNQSSPQTFYSVGVATAL